MRETKVHSIKKISARWLILTLMKINDAAQGFPKTETALLPAPFWMHHVDRPISLWREARLPALAGGTRGSSTHYTVSAQAL